MISKLTLNLHSWPKKRHFFFILIDILAPTYRNAVLIKTCTYVSKLKKKDKIKTSTWKKKYKIEKIRKFFTFSVFYISAPRHFQKTAWGATILNSLGTSGLGDQSVAITHGYRNILDYRILFKFGYLFFEKKTLMIVCCEKIWSKSEQPVLSNEHFCFWYHSSRKKFWKT